MNHQVLKDLSNLGPFVGHFSAEFMGQCRDISGGDQTIVIRIEMIEQLFQMSFLLFGDCRHFRRLTVVLVSSESTESQL